MSNALLFDGATALTHWGVIRARGIDATKFLHSQLTQDFSMLSLSQARLAGFCSAKGRLQASFIAWKPAHDEVLLACSASVLPATLKRLSMFVLRSQCKLSDATADLALWGVAGAAVRSHLVDMLVWSKREIDSATIVRLPDAAGVPRALFVRPQGLAVAGVPSPAISLDAWRWLEVQSGVPMIQEATVDQFVPQMLNFELLGGVDFHKGCYPGQEVVARSQYRGTIKRRMFLFDTDVACAAGQEVFHSADPSQPAGMIADAAPRPGSSGSSALVEIKLAALFGGTLHLGAPDGPLLRRGTMPYEVPLDAAQVA
jgi:folate-binding protein YgfZ